MALNVLVTSLICRAWMLTRCFLAANRLLSLGKYRTQKVSILDRAAFGAKPLAHTRLFGSSDDDGLIDFSVRIKEGVGAVASDYIRFFTLTPDVSRYNFTVQPTLRGGVETVNHHS
ncbi:MAG: hypothetical protein ABJQ70_10505 [Roseobacter sp.]